MIFKHPFDSKIGPSEVLVLWVRLDQGVMTSKKYSTLFRASELESHHWVQFNADKTQYIFI